jgi:hypothetical protein
MIRTKYLDFSMPYRGGAGLTKLNQCWQGRLGAKNGPTPVPAHGQVGQLFRFVFGLRLANPRPPAAIPAVQTSF